ncbi:hypothetical protein N2152v2_007214 [Parachlorella kessleri]
MYPVDRLLNWGGATSLALGGLLSLVALFKSKEARQLEAAYSVPSLAALKQLLKVVPLLVAVSGRVWTNKPIKGQLTRANQPPVEAAIIQEREEREYARRTELQLWVRDSDLVRSVVTEAEWALDDGSGVRLPVLLGSDASGDFLQLVGEEYQQATESIPRQLVGEIAGRRELGTRKQERALKVGEAVTAVGELAQVKDYHHPSTYPDAVRTRGTMYVLRAPKAGGPFLITRQQLPDVIASLRAASNTCQQLSLGFVALGAGLLLVSAVRQAWDWWQLRKMRSKIERARQARRAAASAAATPGADASPEQQEQPQGPVVPQEGPTCVICFDEPPNMEACCDI